MAIGSGVSLGPSVDAGNVGAFTTACGVDETTLSAAALATAEVVDSGPCGRLGFSSVGCDSTGGADPAADILFSIVSWGV